MDATMTTRSSDKVAVIRADGVRLDPAQPTWDVWENYCYRATIEAPDAARALAWARKKVNPRSAPYQKQLLDRPVTVPVCVIRVTRSTDELGDVSGRLCGSVTLARRTSSTRSTITSSIYPTPQENT